jgi:hypothetical protein
MKFVGLFSVTTGCLLGVVTGGLQRRIELVRVLEALS